MKLVVITADDLGIDPRRDDGIFAAFAAGAITQASLLVGGRNAVDAAARARRVGLPLGLHLDLTEMPASAADVGTLLDSAGAKLGKHGLRAAVTRGAVARAHVEREAAAQLERFAQLSGAPARHVDGHQHVHVVPALAAWLAPLLAAHGVASVRIPWEAEVRIADPAQQRFYQGVRDDAAAARALYAGAGLGSTWAFVGLELMGGAAGGERLAAAVQAAPGASLEVMTHPGYRGRGVDAFNEAPAREHELAVLLERPLHRLAGVEMCSFDALAARGALRR
jgi:predicted glycoside hydrolase/deacetylase ChbG (UPF0249 family)